MIDMPTRAGAARAASSGAGVFSTEGAHLRAVAFDASGGGLRPDARHGDEQSGQIAGNQYCSLRHTVSTLPSTSKCGFFGDMG